MTMRHISQREARRLEKRVYELEQERNNQRRSWCRDYSGGINLGFLARERDWLSGRIESARMLGHAIVVIESSDGTLNFYALPQGN
jgi:hypothetical protein